MTLAKILLLVTLVHILLKLVVGPPTAEVPFSAADYLKEGDDKPRPPILLLPGLVSSRLVAWKRKVCRGPDIQIQDVVWLNLAKMMETMTYDKNCWIDCLKLGRNGTDPPDCKIRADEGLAAIGELSPGNLYTPPTTSIFTALIKKLASELGYDKNSLIGGAFDWRLAPIQLQARDSYFTNLKNWIEVAVTRHKRPAIIIAHSMGTNLFMYFCDWLRVHDKPPGGWDKWVRTHIWAYIGIAAPLLGSPGALKSVMSGHTFGLTISEAQARELELTFSSTHFLNPRSSQTIINRKCPNLLKNVTSDYREPIVSIKSASGGSSVSFGINDVENGEIFRWVGNMYNEPLMLEKYETLQELYMKDPLKPLEKLFKRPPIKNVLMIYGTDMPTEVGYTYRIGDAVTPGPPILDEIYYEEACRPPPPPVLSNAEGQGPDGSGSPRPQFDPKGRHRMGLTSSSLRNKDWDDTAAVGTEGSDSASIGTGTGASTCGSNNNNNNNNNNNQGAGEACSTLFDRKDKPIPPDDSSNINNNNNKNLEQDFTPLQEGDLSHEHLQASIDAANFTINGADISLPVNSVQSNALMIVEHIKKGERKETSNEGGLGPGPTQKLPPEDEDKSLSRARGNTPPPILPQVCKAEVHAVQLKKSVLGGGPSRTGRRSRRFVRHTEQSHSGDATVPYVSLSFAHTWLREEDDDIDACPPDPDTTPTPPIPGAGRGNNVWAEYRPEIVRRTDVGFENIIMTSKSHTIDPAVDMYHSRRANGDRTVVMEVKGVDHLEIAKHSYVHFLMFENLLVNMEKDLCLDASCQAMEVEKQKQAAANPLDLTSLSNAVASVTMSAFEYIRGNLPF